MACKASLHIEQVHHVACVPADSPPLVTRRGSTHFLPHALYAQLVRLIRRAVHASRCGARTTGGSDDGGIEGQDVRHGRKRLFAHVEQGEQEKEQGTVRAAEQAGLLVNFPSFSVRPQSAGVSGSGKQLSITHDETGTNLDGEFGTFALQGMSTTLQLEPTSNPRARDAMIEVIAPAIQCVGDASQTGQWA